MITETGTVIALKGEQVWVQTIRQSACESCSARSGCGQRVLASVSDGRANQVLVHNAVNARVGDEVTLGIDEQALLAASLVVYAVPLLLMVLASIAGHKMSGGLDAGAIMGAVVGLAAGFWIGRWIQAGRGDRYQPRLLRVSRIATGQLA